MVISRMGSQHKVYSGGNVKQEYQKADLSLEALFNCLKKIEGTRLIYKGKAPYVFLIKALL